MLDHDATVRRVQVAGGLVREDDARAGRHGAGDGQTLTLAAGEQLRAGAQAVAEAQEVEGLARPDVPFVPRNALDAQAEGGVGAHGLVPEHVAGLEDEAEHARA
ncbi:hypothetical protein GY12_07795 [Micrococcus luteus]|nr:hypothetical protein GY12_07795 [Micrococcus luteus]